jgi:MiaB/RimO family radical SAM methylthiotransferase
MNKVYIDSNGCAVLRHETERIARYFTLNGWILEKSPEVADIVILTCCGVTHNEEDEAIGMLRKLEEIRTPDSRIIVSGCMPAFAKERVLDVSPQATILKYAELVQLDGIISADVPFETVYYNVHPQLESENNSEYDTDMNLQLMRKIDRLCGSRMCEQAWNVSTLRKYMWDDNKTFQIKVSYGCPGKCSYCATKIGIGDFRSVDKDFIMMQFSEGLKMGYDHFILMGDEIGAYGRDIGTTLPELLQQMYDKSDGKATVSIRYIHPDILVTLYDRMKKFFALGFVNYFCCAIQSASPTVLMRMNRNPNIEPFIRCMEDINKNNYPVSKHTQIIVGFPGEISDDVLLTMDALRRCEFEHININLYSPRQHTAAWNMKETVTQEEKIFRAELIRHSMKLYKKALLYDAIKTSMLNAKV